ncbi:hypothetical protein EYZ11_007429 [Aspergillus tanneri]|uniref:Uncharacterized protein n=1 Tax=Aspergillus tanneri TaxID=1220188 RepID=A0A4S3JIN3_9EURO|nr:hypothetical protein EYZ11_007429 [Aspergillus tanneri]
MTTLYLVGGIRSLVAIGDKVVLLTDDGARAAFSDSQRIVASTTLYEDVPGSA